MKYGFIGCGNMGSAIVTALAKSTKDILITDPSDAAKTFASETGVSFGTAQEVCRCDRVFLAVKPQVLASALAPLKEALSEKKPVIISMAAGVPIEKIQALIGTPLPIIRIMPNTPVAVGKGMILYCHNDLVSREIADSFVSDMCHSGKLDSIPEALIDAGSALSGCGPAFMYMFLEALADGAVACGVPRAKAIRYAAQTMAGSAEMILSTGKHPGELKDAVCSPGGSTIAGVKALEDSGFRGAVIDCVIEAYKKTRDLGK